MLMMYSFDVHTLAAVRSNLVTNRRRLHSAQSTGLIPLFGDHSRDPQSKERVR